MSTVNQGAATMSAEQLLETLEQKRAEADVVFVTGLAKKLDGRADEISFAQAPSYAAWVSIPTSMIEHAQVLGWYQESGTPLASVRLALRTPSTPDGTALANLVRHRDITNLRGDGTLPLSTAGAGLVPLRGDGTLPLAGGGTLPLAGSGTLPLGGGSGTLPLGGGSGTLPLGGGSGTLPLAGNGTWPLANDGTLPLYLAAGPFLIPLGWRFGNGLVPLWGVRGG